LLKGLSYFETILDSDLVYIADRKPDEVKAEYEQSFYRMRNEKKVPLYLRKTERDYYDVIGVFNQVLKVLGYIRDGKDLLD
jgi:hypothetical protein